MPFLTILAIFVIIGIIVNALLLGVVLGWTKGENRELGTTFVTALFLGLSMLLYIIPPLGCLAQWYVLKSRHELTWGGAIATWILLIIVVAIVGFLISFIFPFLFVIPTIPYP
jgi:hypothetical protein